MKSALLVVLLAAAATAAVVSNGVPDAVVLPDKVDVYGNEDVDVNVEPEVSVNDVLDLPDPTDAEEETAVDTRRNLAVGAISGTRVFNSQQGATGILGRQIVRDITVRPNGGRRVTAVRVTRIGSSQNATPSIIGGGVGSTSVTIRIRSATSRGFNYRVEVYAR